MREQAQSGLTKNAFCEQHGINLGTFHGWSKKTRAIQRRSRFAFELTDHRRAVIVSDSIRAGKPTDLWWFAHTGAQVTLGPDQRTAILRIGSKSLRVQLEGPEGLRFGVMDASPLPGSPHPEVQDPNRGRRKLFIHQPNVTALELHVRFMPDWGP
jgi:hypothetical protein